MAATKRKTKTEPRKRKRPPQRKLTERRTFSYRPVEGRMLDYMVEQSFENPIGKHSSLLARLVRGSLAQWVHNGVVAPPPNIDATEYEGWDEALGLHANTTRTLDDIRRFMAQHGLTREASTSQ